MEVDDLEHHEEYLTWVAKCKATSLDQKKYMLRRLKDNSCRQTTWLTTHIQSVKGKRHSSNKIPKEEEDLTMKRDQHLDVEGPIHLALSWT